MSADAVLGQLDTAANKLSSFPTQLSTSLDGLTAKVNAQLDHVPGWVKSMFGWVIDKIKWLGNEIAKLAKELSNWFVKNVWPVIKGPHTLWVASNKWTTDVFHNSSTVSGNINTAKTNLDDWWQGAAATAYGQIPIPQKQASDKIGEISSKVKDSLQGLTFSLTAIYIAVAALLGWCLLQIPVITGAIASFFGIPAGLFDALATMLLVAGGGAALFAGAQVLAQDTLGTFGTLLQLKNDNSAFENGHWPKDAKTVGEIGDGSNWHYKG